jgi:hypothetical protein
MNTLEQVLTILEDYKLESNIPVNHPYWELLNDFRAGRLDVPVREYRVLQPEPKAPPSGTPGQMQAKLAQLRNQNRMIMQSFGNREPKIPYNDDYWFIKNQISGLERELAAL